MTSSTNLPVDLHDQRLIDDKAAADFLSVARQTLANWRMLRTGPRYSKISGRSIRYRVSDLIAFANSTIITPGGDDGNDKAA